MKSLSRDGLFGLIESHRVAGTLATVFKKLWVQQLQKLDPCLRNSFSSPLRNRLRAHIAELRNTRSAAESVDDSGVF